MPERSLEYESKGFAEIVLWRVSRHDSERQPACRMRGKQCDADRSEEENDRAGDHPRRVVAPQVDVAAVKKAKQGHYKRYGSEQYADSVIHMSCFNG